MMTRFGGGDRIEAVFSDQQVCAAVAYQASVPIVSAVGHAGNHPLVEAVVHHAFDTPSLFGTWLKERVVTATDMTAQQLALLEGFPEESEKFCTLGDLPLLDKHLQALSKTRLNENRG